VFVNIGATTVTLDNKILYWTVYRSHKRIFSFWFYFSKRELLGCGLLSVVRELETISSVVKRWEDVPFSWC